ncbi:hypothetical protein GA0115239_101062 [Streptomyces sp. BpilaLS-43]|nr:hypothetical protein GA0115239_101062 [Streptomyces sp. BpilaLS-43]
MKTWKILRDWRLEGDGVHHAMLGIARLRNLALAGFVVAMLLTQCAQSGRTFWGWTEEEWFHLLGRTQAEFRRNAPTWAGRPTRKASISLPDSRGT